MMILESVIKATKKVLKYFGHGVSVMADARREFGRLRERVGDNSAWSRTELDVERGQLKGGAENVRKRDN